MSTVQKVIFIKNTVILILLLLLLSFRTVRLK